MYNVYVWYFKIKENIIFIIFKESEQTLKKYKIAVIIACINESYQSAILNGIKSSAEECSLDFSVFVSFSGTMGNPKHDKGEFNIFSLPDFSKFDGAVLLTNTIDYPAVVRDIIERIKKSGIPAVSIDNDLPDMFHIGIDNKTAMRKITEHFINVHGFTKFNYISGPADNPESADRLDAFLEVLKENNISIEKDRIYYGDFRAPSGKSAIESFLMKNAYMPQAIICANDVMASTAINRLFEYGYKVPSEIAVSGFDNTYQSHNYQIELTSVERPLSLSGKLACKMLYNHFNNIPQKRSITLDMYPKFTESCGCSGGTDKNINEFKALNYANYSKYENTQTYMGVFNCLSCDLLACNTFEQYIQTLKKFVAEINPEEFYFCLCDNWNSDSFSNKKAIIHNEKQQIPTSYTEEMLVPIAYKDGLFHETGKIKSSSIVPDIAEDNKLGKFYYIIPLHFGERCLGYMVIRINKLPLHNSMFQSCCITISNSLENIRKIINLGYAVKTLGKLYAQDTFAGIFNRNGFVDATAEVYADCIKNQRNIMLMFIDLDGLKTINDTYGHDTGDKAICSIADVLVQSCTKGEVYCRFGGDEFIIFSADATEEYAENLTRTIEENIRKINDTHKNVFTLSASTGYIIKKPKEENDLFKFVTEADKVMYKEKRKKKLSKYLKT